MYCSAHQGRLVTKAEIADVCKASENHLAQVINQLGQMGVINTQRGRNGGLELARPPAEIEIGSIFRMMEVTASAPECIADADNSCPLASACRLRDALQEAVEAFYARLDQVTLGSLICDNPALDSILIPEPCERPNRLAS